MGRGQRVEHVGGDGGLELPREVDEVSRRGGVPAAAPQQFADQPGLVEGVVVGGGDVRRGRDGGLRRIGRGACDKDENESRSNG
jgi:hypothetical protein